MSVHLDALADEVFAAAAAQALGEGETVRLPFGEVRRNLEYPDLFFLNGISDLRAPDWTGKDLERALREHLPGIGRLRVSSRDPMTVARLGPGLVDAGWEADARVAMVQVSPPDDLAAAALEIHEVETDQDWRAYERLIEEGGLEHGWSRSMIAQLERLYRWQAENQPQTWLLTFGNGEAVAHAGLYQHGTVGYFHALYTRRSFRRRGAGSTLVNQAGRLARRLGCERLTLQCSRDSFLPAYYQAMGFRIVGEMSVWIKS